MVPFVSASALSPALFWPVFVEDRTGEMQRGAQGSDRTQTAPFLGTGGVTASHQVHFLSSCCVPS